MSITKPPIPTARVLCEGDRYTQSQVGALLQFIQTPDGQKQAQKTTYFKVQAREHSQRGFARVVITALAAITIVSYIYLSIVRLR